MYLANNNFYINPISFRPADLTKFYGPIISFCIFSGDGGKCFAVEPNKKISSLVLSIVLWIKFPICHWSPSKLLCDLTKEIFYHPDFLLKPSRIRRFLITAVPKGFIFNQNGMHLESGKTNPLVSKSLPSIQVTHSLKSKLLN